MTKTKANASEARQRIVETAERLFYADGIRAVGIDRIIAQAGVAKMSLYNHFASKDDLILAVLQYREEKFQNQFDRSLRKHLQTGLNSLDAFFAGLKDWFESDGFRGCMFINSHVELADTAHPASKFTVQHKKRFYNKLQEILVETLGEKVAQLIASQVALLVEGSIVSAAMNQNSAAADVARAATLALAAKAKK